jgi:hypothetical protein
MVPTRAKGNLREPKETFYRVLTFFDFLPQTTVGQSKWDSDGTMIQIIQYGTRFVNHFLVITDQENDRLSRLARQQLALRCP